MYNSHQVLAKKSKDNQRLGRNPSLFYYFVL
jgi:hypothetical protein